MKKYAIWDKKSDIITPNGKVYTAEEWKEKYPAAKLDSVTVICGAGEINGAYFSTLGQKVAEYERYGCDFSECKTSKEKLAVIEAYDEAREAEANAAARESEANASLTADSLASIAASLEFQNMMSLPDVEV